MTPFQVGEAVSWKSQAGGNVKQKTGFVAAVVQAGDKPLPYVKDLGLKAKFDGGSPRPHESYLVRVRDGKTENCREVLYWPLVNALRVVVNGTGPSALQKTAAPAPLIGSASDPFIKKLLSFEGTIAELIPEDTSADVLLANLRSVVGGLKRLDEAEAKLGPVAGHIMAMASTNHAIFLDAGYESLEKFCEAEVYAKVGRTRAWVYKEAKEVWPDATVEELAAAGYKKLEFGAKVAKKLNAGPSQRRKILERAADKDETVDEFKAGVSAPVGGQDEVTGAEITLKGSKADVAALEKYLEDEDFLTKAESKRPVKAILNAIAEFMS